MINSEIVDAVREVWGDRLRPIPPEFLSPLLSAQTHWFVRTVGLPAVETVYSEPVSDEEFRVARHRRQGHEYVAVAEGAGYYYGIEVDTDRVMMVSDGRADTYVVNSDVALFVLFLGVVEKTLSALDEQPDLADDRIEEAIYGVIAQLRLRDAEAMAGRDNFWFNLLCELLEF
ncbi:SUKH-4 family immunity protein [Nocardia sp. NPDC004604]|uniref:SUKH-4 family immunity protein n=1 Tax=Nocardia sp. NPDC004604 TaxID=3157013 RepID=UPI00339EF73F